MSRMIKVPKVTGKIKEKFTEQEIKSAPTPIIEGSRLKAFESLRKNIEQARNTVTKPNPGPPPVFRKIPIEERFEKAGTRIEMDPYEVKHIVTAAMLSDNDLVIDAFKKFLMVAKMSLEIPLEDTREMVRQHRQEFEDSLTEHYNQVTEHHKSIETRTNNIKEAQCSMINAWRILIEEFQNCITKNQALEALAIDDQFFIRAVESKKLARINNGIINVKWDQLKAISPEDMIQILQNAEELKIQEAEQVRLDYLYSASYDDLKSIIDDTNSGDEFEEVWYILHHRAINGDLKTKSGNSISIEFIVHLGAKYGVRLAEHLIAYDMWGDGFASKF